MDFLLKIDDLLFLIILAYGIQSAAAFFIKKSKIEKNLSPNRKVLPPPSDNRSMVNKMALILWGLIFAFTFFNIIEMINSQDFSAFNKTLIPAAASLIFLVINYMKKGEYDDGMHPALIFYDDYGFLLQTNPLTFNLKYYKWNELRSYETDKQSSNFVTVTFHLSGTKSKKLNVDAQSAKNIEDLLNSKTEK